MIVTCGGMRWSLTIWMPVACRASVASMWPSARAIGPVRTRLACSAADEPSIGAAIANIQHRIAKATSDDAVPPRLVAVSKTKYALTRTRAQVQRVHRLLPVLTLAWRFGIKAR